MLTKDERNHEEYLKKYQDRKQGYIINPKEWRMEKLKEETKW